MFKKMKSFYKVGLEPFMEGKKNYETPKESVEAKAARRAEECAKCLHYEDEPIKMFQIQDERIPQLSKKMCGECSCSLPYLLRQSQKICKKWQASTSS